MKVGRPVYRRCRLRSAWWHPHRGPYGKYFDALLTAAPDRASRDVVLVAEDDHVVEEARYTGTHTGTWRNPDGAEVPATGKKLDFPFVGVFRVENGKISSVCIYYDQIEVFTQLGLMPAATAS